ncbi:hypothetical protein [Kineosporia succinea]|uniref:Uncharacterized protein n=1 Tax=Kineosporia succinea TaxID=84632 RepID=A0ABT9P8Q6_9ACTN|nr:hypothetical protein [Kineosporia succinea]MDP9829074.1 hypothetical protein [Kineosporia succinea]
MDIELPIDIALLALILLFGGYAAVIAAVVAHQRQHPRPAAVGLATLGLVPASFFVAIALVHVNYFAMVAFVALAVGTACYRVLRPDLGRRARGVAIGAALVTTTASLLVSYLAPMAFVATASTYLLVRRRITPRIALMATGTAFAGMLVVAGAVFYVGVSTM